MSEASTLDFDALYTLKQFIDRVRERHAESLLVFEDKQSLGFKQSEARSDKADLSMSSTGTSIGSLVVAGVWGALVSQSKRGWWYGREKLYVQKLLKEKWDSAGLEPDNPFTVGFVVEACAHLQQVAGDLITDKALRSRQKKAIKILHDSLMRRSPSDNTPVGSVSVLQYPPSAYLTQLVARSLKLIGELSPEESDAITKWAMKEVAAQITLIVSQSRLADPLQLAYAILCSVSYQSSSRRTPTDVETIRFALKVFFGTQLANGSWPQSRPLFHYPFFGSAYCYDYEALAQMLGCSELHEMMFEHLPNFDKAASALDQTKFEVGDGGYGWASSQIPQLPGPESWATASVYLFLHNLDRLVAEAIRRSIAIEVESPYSGLRLPLQNEEMFANEFLDCPISAAKTERDKLKSAIFRTLVEPIAKGVGFVQKGQKLPKTVPVSAIFFGPPGTSKTEIAEQIANYIGWPVVSVDPSYFVKAGLDQIQAQANRIFRMLSTAEQMVVLFDEFDEMVRNRADSGEILSRFLTTAMLPKLIKINKARRILFIVATNYIDSFDLAISRPGRFDVVMQMMPPLASEKLSRAKWKDCLIWLKKIARSGQFEADLADLTYSETEKLVERVQPHFQIASKPNASKIAKSRAASKATKLWRDALEGSTLRRDNERYPLGASRHLTWKQTSERETKFIRMN